LPEEGFRVGFACVKLDLFDELREARDADLHDVSMRGRLDFRPIARLTRIIRQGDYRLVHCHSVRAAMVGAPAAKRAGVPMVYHVHSPASRDSTRRWFDRFNGLVERWCLCRAARAICVSRAMADHIAGEGFDAARIRVVANGVPSPRTIRNDAVPCGQWTLGTAALFRPRKGLEVLLDALALLRRQGHPVRLRAVGAFESARYESEILRRAAHQNLLRDIVWTGFTRDVGAELAQMDLFVLPSLFGEGMPMVVLEAMAAGVPVVASDIAGVGEAGRHGRDGLLVSPGDAEDLAENIAAMIDGRCDWSAMHHSALGRHAQRFSDRAMAAGVAEVYRELL